MSKLFSGKIKFFNPVQEKVFHLFAADKIISQSFYFTGGTALAAVYLHHRQSEDLDFFSSQEFDNELVFTLINQIASLIKTKSHFTQTGNARIFEFLDGEELVIKLDFAYYPHQRLKLGKKIDDIEVDSLIDIAANKLVTIIQRTEIKDFIDLYFLLKKYTMWDLIYAAEKKFEVEIDIVLLGSDFLKVEQFDFLPKMIKPLKLATLKNFYINQAKKIAKKVVEY